MIRRQRHRDDDGGDGLGNVSFRTAIRRAIEDVADAYQARGSEITTEIQKELRKLQIYNQRRKPK